MLFDIGQPKAGKAGQLPLNLFCVFNARERKLQLPNLCANQIAIPVTLQKVIREAFSPIEKSQPDDVPIEKVRQRRNLERDPIIDPLFDEPLDDRLP